MEGYQLAVNSEYGRSLPLYFPKIQLLFTDFAFSGQ
jgi:hypothetical protein